MAHVPVVVTPLSAHNYTPLNSGLCVSHRFVDDKYQFPLLLCCNDRHNAFAAPTS